ncbi:MAG: 5'/3'-nucleotidase SurE [Anaplasma ovis]
MFSNPGALAKKKKKRTAPENDLCYTGEFFDVAVWMRVLLTNDDGFDSVGMRVLRGIVSESFTEVWVSAPTHDRSAASKSLSVRTPIKVRTVSAQEFAVYGTPVDSVVVGIHEMIKVGKQPDLVISGINYGANTGPVVPYSGTIAAARAASRMGITAIAISQEYNGKRCENNVNDEALWKNSRKSALALVKRLLCDTRWDRKCVMSVNIPCSDVQGVRFTGHDSSNIKWEPCVERHESTSDDVHQVSYTIHDVRSSNGNCRSYDTQLLGQGYIVVTPVGSDVTDHATLDRYCGSQRCIQYT